MADDLSVDGEPPRITIYTDGSANPSTRLGGWAAVMIYQGVRHEKHGAASDTTNNRMELTAAIQALAMLPRRFHVTIVSDSRYLIDPFEKGWLTGWKSRGWVRRSGGQVENTDLWRELADLADQHEVEFRWVRGHSGVVENDRCDTLARAAYA